MHGTGKYSISDLAELFSVSRPTVYRTLIAQGQRVYDRLNPLADSAVHVRCVLSIRWHLFGALSDRPCIDAAAQDQRSIRRPFKRP